MRAAPTARAAGTGTPAMTAGDLPGVRRTRRRFRADRPDEAASLEDV